MQMFFRVEKNVRRCAGRTFLQTVCGVLFAGLAAAVTEPALRMPGWKLCIFALTASAVSAGFSAFLHMLND